MTNMINTKLVFLKNLKNLLLTITILKIINCPFKRTHLWLNKLFKYQNKSIFIKEFYKVGIQNFNQLINRICQLKSNDEKANEYGIKVNNTVFIKYIKLISVIPTKCLDNPPSLGSFTPYKENVS